MPPKVLKKRPDRPTAEDASQKGNYAVQSLIGHRVHKGIEEFLVHWKGWGRSKATWEPISNLSGLEPEMMQLKKQSGKKRARSDMDEDDATEADGLTESPDLAPDGLAALFVVNFF